MSEAKRNSKLVPLTIMIEELQLTDLRHIAKVEERSLSAQIRYLLEQELIKVSDDSKYQLGGMSKCIKC